MQIQPRLWMLILLSIWNVEIPLKYSFCESASQTSLEVTAAKSWALLSHELLERERKADSTIAGPYQSQEPSYYLMLCKIRTDTAGITGTTLVLKPMTKEKHTLSILPTLKGRCIFFPSFVYQSEKKKESPSHYTYIKGRCHWHNLGLNAVQRTLPPETRYSL